MPRSPPVPAARAAPVAPAPPVREPVVEEPCVERVYSMLGGNRLLESSSGPPPPADNGEGDELLGR